MIAEIAEQQPTSHLIRKHPCFNGEAHFKYGRLHLPVSPDCNIQCGFCKRGFNKYEDRPGVSRVLLQPEQAVKLVAKALERCPELTVVGIAGPGDTLATDHALEVFEEVHQRFPQLMNCLSTNGLLLEEKAERVAAAGVKTITVTVNAVDPSVLRQICAYIRYHDQYLTGEYAARRLISAQLAGIRRMVALGGIVKINTVLIPGVNTHQIEQIAEITAKLGASIMNIIPLIPQYRFSQHRPPNCEELMAARESAEKFLPVFRHCRHCRADAFGIPGRDTDDRTESLYDSVAQTFSHG
jgi:nitrogen fixation protein NifB